MTVSFVLLGAAVQSSCSRGEQSGPNLTPPGAQKSALTKTLEAGAAVVQTQPPIEALNVYMDGFHFANGDPQRQMEAHHYCALLNEEG